MNDPAKEFSNIRVFGTIGWVTAGMVISYIFHWDSPSAIESGALKNTFLMTAVASAILGLFSFSLPKHLLLCLKIKELVFLIFWDWMP